MAVIVILYPIEEQEHSLIEVAILEPDNGMAKTFGSVAAMDSEKVFEELSKRGNLTKKIVILRHFSAYFRNL
ncbi:hypothetical protein [Paenibacillus illinoisensis]|uniref:hypothetical protein n=1 Tax=Paenibacillus illinoisensis TaxID=59845 RepID=UPI0030159B0D